MLSVQGAEVSGVRGSVVYVCHSGLGGICEWFWPRWGKLVWVTRRVSLRTVMILIVVKVVVVYVVQVG